MKRILRDNESIESSLKRNDIVDINDYKRKALLAREIQDAKKEYIRLKSEIKLQEIESKRSELNAEQLNLQFECENMNIKSTLAKAKRFTDFTNKINECTEKEIDELQVQGKRFAKTSMICSILSAITSCLGIYAVNRTVSVMFIVSCIIMIVISAYNNHIINNVTTVIRKFYKKDVASIVLTTLMFILSFLVIVYSVFTNYQFWRSVQNSLIATVIYSCVFDIASIVFALLSNLYQTLDFNQEYIESMQHFNSEQTMVPNLIQPNLKEVEQKENEYNLLENYDLLKEETEQKDEQHFVKPRREIKHKPTKQDVYEAIEKLEINTVFTPKTLGIGIHAEPNYYSWLKEWDIVEKNENGKYVRVDNKRNKFKVY